MSSRIAGGALAGMFVCQHDQVQTLRVDDVMNEGGFVDGRSDVEEGLSQCFVDCSLCAGPWSKIVLNNSHLQHGNNNETSEGSTNDRGVRGEGDGIRRRSHNNFSLPTNDIMYNEIFRPTT